MFVFLGGSRGFIVAIVVVFVVIVIYNFIVVGSVGTCMAAGAAIENASEAVFFFDDFVVVHAVAVDLGSTAEKYVVFASSRQYGRPVVAIVAVVVADPEGCVSRPGQIKVVVGSVVPGSV